MTLEALLQASVQEQQRTNALLQRLVDQSGSVNVPIAKAAKELGVSVATIWNWIHTGLYTPYREGKVVRVNVAEIRATMKRNGRMPHVV